MEKRKVGKKCKKENDPYFPLLPFLPSGQFSEDLVAKKVNKRGKLFLKIQEIGVADGIISHLYIHHNGIKATRQEGAR